MIELITYLAIVFCGEGNLECRDFIEDCMLDGEEYKFCKQDYRERLKWINR